MKNIKHKIKEFKNMIRVGFFLALRSVYRSNKWTTLLIIGVMTLTFLNLVVISGILVGLIEGSVSTIEKRFTGHVLVRTLDEKEYIENSTYIQNVLDTMSEVKTYTSRFHEGGLVEANYKEKTDDKSLSQDAASVIVGIDPERENQVSGLSEVIIEGEYLSPDDYDSVLVGAFLLKEYLTIESPGFRTLDARVGDRVRVKVGDAMREVTIKGVLKSKADEVDLRTFFVDKQLRGMIGRDDFNVDEIAILLHDQKDSIRVKQALLAAGVGAYAKVQTSEDAFPKFLEDIKTTFAMLGNVIGSIGLAVASITIFIVIFINAVTRRKFIGILKGIGVNHRAIEWSYVFQSIFYAICGSTIGLLLVYFVLVPFFLAHPINFPFSDGILVADVIPTFIRAVILIIITLFAGYIPARMIVRKNTLNAILGR